MRNDALSDDLWDLVLGGSKVPVVVLRRVCRTWHRVASQLQTPVPTSAVVARDHLDVLQWLVETHSVPPVIHLDLIHAAIRSDLHAHLDLVCMRGRDMSPSAVCTMYEFACVYGSYACMLHMDNCWSMPPLDAARCQQMTLASVIGGNLEVVSYLYFRHPTVQLRSEEFLAAVMHGHEDILYWLFTHGCAKSAAAYFPAVVRNDLPLMQRLRGVYGCPWNELVTHWAELYARSDLLEWLRAHGCP